MNLPKEIEKLFIANQEGIAFDEHDFGVARPITANFFVGRAFGCAAAISHGGGQDAFELSKCRLDSPKTSRPESRFFHKMPVTLRQIMSYSALICNTATFFPRRK